MNWNADIITKSANQILNVLLLNSPYDTCIGFVIGIVFDGFLPPILEPITQNWLGIDLSTIGSIHWIAFSILVMNGKNIFRKSHISAEAEAAFALIKEARKIGLTDLEIKQKYRYIIEKYANNIALSKEAQEQIELMHSLRTSSNQQHSQADEL